MMQQQIVELLQPFFPGAFTLEATVRQSPDFQRMLDRIQRIPSNPLSLTHSTSSSI
jgi:hypothetical protein